MRRARVPRYRRAARTVVSIVLLGGLLAGCGGIRLDPDPPGPFDLDGRWLLVEEDSDATPDPRRLRAQGGMMAFVTQDFPVLRAEEIAIEQGPDSMGVRYDGERYRDVSWGTRRRGLWEVRAGWSEGRLLILSKASDAEAQEAFTLSPDGERLRIDVEIRSSGDRLAVTRVFARQ